MKGQSEIIVNDVESANHVYSDNIKITTDAKSDFGDVYHVKENQNLELGRFSLSNKGVLRYVMV